MVNGPKHATELLKGLREKAWAGSGDDKRDLRNISTTLTNSDRFENKGNNTWALKLLPKEVV